MLPKILDITPALAFFITYKITSDLITATAVIVGCCLIAFALQYVFWKKVSRMQVFVCAIYAMQLWSGRRLRPLPA